MTRRKGMYLKVFRILIMDKKIIEQEIIEKQQEKKSYWLTIFKKKINLDINEFHSIREVLLKCF